MKFMMSAMVAHPDASQQDLSSLRLCTSAGEVCAATAPASVRSRLDRPLRAAPATTVWVADRKSRVSGSRDCRCGRSVSP